MLEGWFCGQRKRGELDGKRLADLVTRLVLAVCVKSRWLLADRVDSLFVGEKRWGWDEPPSHFVGPFPHFVVEQPELSFTAFRPQGRGECN